MVIAPSIDVFSPKNEDLDRQAVLDILRSCGVLAGARGPARGTFHRQDGTPGRVDRHAELFEDRPLEPGMPVVLQISRWDSLKDPLGVIRGFADHVPALNALQRHATVIAQKSLAEGFGLTVAEAMWKARPVVASRIGGIQSQIVDGESGVLLDDPRDLGAFGAAITDLLLDRPRATKIGERARERVRDEFTSPRSLLDYLAVIDTVLERRGIRLAP